MNIASRNATPDPRWRARPPPMPTARRASPLILHQRPQAMANAQDVLTRSKWQRADLGELIGKELTQVRTDFDASGLNGPAVRADERTTQALGLTFTAEPVTNTLKYAGAELVDVSGRPMGTAWHRLVRDRRGGGRNRSRPASAPG